VDEAIELRKNESTNQYELGRADHHVAGNTVVLPSVVIDPSARGRNLGSTLTKFALDDIVAADKRVNRPGLLGTCLAAA